LGVGLSGANHASSSAHDGKAGEESSVIRVAQAGSTDESANGANAADVRGVGESLKLDEIVVTAQKRPEKLRDVPVSISVITADDIDRRGLVSSEDYLRGIPGVSQLGDSLGQAIIIRGLETATAAQNYGSGATTGTYFGETPTTSSAG